MLRSKELEDDWLKLASQAQERRFSSLKTRRLGERFEANLFSLLETHPDVLEFSSNVKIGSIGEADILLRLRENPDELYHIETAVKFYLCLVEGGSHRESDYVGPALKDSLEKKLARLKTHQLKVFEKADARFAQKTQIQSEAFVSGILFYPFSEKHSLSRALEHPKTIEVEHARGIWVHQSGLERLFRGLGVKRGAFLESKNEWIRNRYPNELLQVSELSLRINEHFKTTSQPNQCEIFTPRGEIIRTFVVPDSWPSW